MIDIPSHVKIAATIKTGAVYYFVGDSFLSKEPHYFVILNSNPFDSISLIVVNATSKISKREAYVKKRKLPNQTLIRVTEKECSFLKLPSVFDCNSVSSYTPQRLLELCETGVFKYKGEVTAVILEKLKLGVKTSPLVKKEFKKLIE